MATDRIVALRELRSDVVAYCRGLSEPEWGAASRASGWLVRDVVAHMGATCRLILSRNMIRLLRSPDTERDNEPFVQQRRSWSSQRVLAEFTRWSGLAATTMAVASRSPLHNITVRSGSLGRYPAWLLPSSLVFDWHTHLTYDIAPALGKPAPPAGAGRLTATLEWMLAGMEQMNRDRMGWVDRPVRLSLTGPGGGRFDVSPAGHGLLRIRPADPSTVAAAHITGSSVDFPGWATTRLSWREADLTIAGDRDYACRFLDAVNVV